MAAWSDACGCVDAAAEGVRQLATSVDAALHYHYRQTQYDGSSQKFCFKK